MTTQRLADGERVVLVLLFDALPGFCEEVTFFQIFKAVGGLGRSFRNGAALQSWTCHYVERLEAKGMLFRPSKSSLSITGKGWDYAAKFVERRTRKQRAAEVKESTKRTRRRRRTK